MPRGRNVYINVTYDSCLETLDMSQLFLLLFLRAIRDIDKSYLTLFKKNLLYLSYISFSFKSTTSRVKFSQ